MIIREIQKQDNPDVEQLIRTCLIEFGANKPGTAWSDPDLGRFYELYQKEQTNYWVAIEDNKLVAGCGIGDIPGRPDVCELQKMYAAPSARGSGVAERLLQTSLTFAKQHYNACYLETIHTMHAANRFYQKHGFKKLDAPLLETEHFSCDAWYIKTLQEE
ncbi:GNAT family N-acetyltransferase [Shouchella sp. JSM 1781072]|uniref:GNAT family N-acetyltransferase n=1 Tax=Shouchella sp. JSM 1781072 TaxID=3344581 RepID=UPI0035C061B8